MNLEAIPLKAVGQAEYVIRTGWHDQKPAAPFHATVANRGVNRERLIRS